MLATAMLALHAAAHDCTKSGYTEGQCGSVSVKNVHRIDKPTDTVNRDSFGPPSSTLTLTFMSHRVPAWADLRGAELRNPPPMLSWLPTFVPSGVLATGSEIVFHCPDQPWVEVCDAWVFFYHCPQSCTPKYQGGVITDLQGDWEFTKCAPAFTTGVPSGYVHQMKSFRKKLGRGDTEVVTIGRDTEFVAFSIDANAEDCQKHADKTGCDGAGDSCVWEGAINTCLPNVCRRPGRGPPPPCLECPWEGIVMRPPSDGPF